MSKPDFSAAFLNKYVVMNENTLGHLIQGPSRPMLGILHSSVLKGSTFDRLAGAVEISPLDVLRNATIRDFDDYRVCSPRDFEG